MSTAVINPHCWTRVEYERMIAAGVFHPEARLELIDGTIVTVTPQGSVHATAIGLMEQALRLALGAGYYIRIQMPLALSDASEPEPDVAVVAGTPRDYRFAHPSTAVLVVEVAEATLNFDREQKKKLYARSAIPEYWVINLVDNQLEVYRGPQTDDFAWKTTLRRGDSVSPLAFSDSSVRVDDLLP